MRTDNIWIRPVAAALLLAASTVAFGQQTGNLKVKTTTGRAGVFLDDKYLGPASNFGMARSYAVPAGEHTITLREPRYEVATTKVTIVAGKTVTVHQDMKALPEPKGPFGRLRIEGPEKFAAVYVNGSYMGHVDEFNNFAQGLLMPAGEYTLKIVPVSGGPGVEQKIDLKANQTTLIHASGK